MGSIAEYRHRLVTCPPPKCGSRIAALAGCTAIRPTGRWRRRRAHRAQGRPPSSAPISRGYANWTPPERLLGVLNGVGAVLHVFQDVISGRGPVQDFSGLLAGETLIDRQAHPTAAASGVHLHE